MDNLGRGLAGNRIVELVLHHGIEFLGDGRVLVIVKAAFGENIGHLLPDTPLAGPNGADTVEQFAEIVLAKNLPALLQALVIQHKAFLDEFLQGFCCPDPELCGFGGIHPIANRDDGVEVVEICLIGFAVCGSMCKFCTY